MMKWMVDAVVGLLFIGLSGTALVEFHNWVRKEAVLRVHSAGYARSH